MDGENNHESIYYPEDNEFRIFCNVCNLLCIERFYKNHLKSGTHLNNFYKRQRLNKN